MFQFCPQCREPLNLNAEWHQLDCANCGFIYFHNTASSVAAIIRFHDKVLLTRRAKQPGIHLWDLPGGFVDPRESLETALTRELREELGLTTNQFRYFTSEPNRYEYKGVPYQTCDAIFVCEFTYQPELSADDGEVMEFEWVRLKDVNLDQVAFPSIRQALKRYLQLHTQN